MGILVYRTILVTNASIISAAIFLVEMKMIKTTCGGAANAKKSSVWHVFRHQSAGVVRNISVTNVK